MMDAVLMLMKESVEDAVRADSRIPSGRKDIATEVCMKAVADAFKKCFVSDDVSSAGQFFLDSMDFKSYLVTNSIKDTVRRGLAVKIGLVKDLDNVTDAIVHQILDSIKKKIAAQDEAEFTLDSLVYVFSGRRIVYNDSSGRVMRE